MRRLRRLAEETRDLVAGLNRHAREWTAAPDGNEFLARYVNDFGYVLFSWDRGALFVSSSAKTLVKGLHAMVPAISGDGARYSVPSVPGANGHLEIHDPRRTRPTQKQVARPSYLEVALRAAAQPQEPLHREVARFYSAEPVIRPEGYPYLGALRGLYVLRNVNREVEAATALDQGNGPSMLAILVTMHGWPQFEHLVDDVVDVTMDWMHHFADWLGNAEERGGVLSATSVVATRLFADVEEDAYDVVAPLFAAIVDDLKRVDATVASDPSRIDWSIYPPTPAAWQE